MDVFDHAWDMLERAGICDGHGGAEYQRVRRAWLTGGELNAIAAFITVEANRMPPMLPLAPPPPTSSS